MDFIMDGMLRIANGLALLRTEEVTVTIRVDENKNWAESFVFVKDGDFLGEVDIKGKLDLPHGPLTGDRDE